MTKTWFFDVSIGMTGLRCELPGKSQTIRSSSFASLPSVSYSPMHPFFKKADELSHAVIGAAIEVHRIKGPGLLFSTFMN